MSILSLRQIVAGLQQRQHRLGISAAELGIADELALLELHAACSNDLDVHLEGVIAAIEHTLRDAESLTQQRPFVDPPFLSSSVESGTLLAHTWNGIPLNVEFGGTLDRSVTHLQVCGVTNSGKSTLFAQIARGVSANCSCLIIDSTRSFRGRELPGFVFVRWEDLRLNPFDPLGVCSPTVSAQVAIRELASNYKLIYGEYELIDAACTLIERNGSASWPAVLAELKHMTFPRYSRRMMYVESCLLVVSTLLTATGELFSASQGMDLFELCTGKLVIEVDGLLPQHRGYLIRTLFACLHAGAVIGQKSLSQRLVFMIDETQELASQQGFAAKLLDARHAKLHVVFAMQNPSTVAVELAGNVSGVIGFQLVDGRDQSAFGSAAGLNRDQQAFMAKLRAGECVCRFPGMAYTSAFLARVPDVPRIVGERDVNAVSREFVSRLSWTRYGARNGEQPRHAVAQAAQSGVAAEEDGREGAATVTGSANAAGHCGRVENEKVRKCEQLSSDELRVLIEASAHWSWGVTRLYERVGLDRVRGRRVVEGLHARGMVLPHAIASGKRGGGLRLLEVTERGWSELEKRGFEKLAGVTRGGFVHNAVAMALAERGKALGHEVRFEQDLGGVFGDVVFVSTSGRMTVLQIGLSSTTWEAGSVNRLLGAAGVDEVVLAVKDRQFLKNVTGRLEEVMKGEAAKGRVKLCCIGEVLADETAGSN